MRVIKLVHGNFLNSLWIAFHLNDMITSVRYDEHAVKILGGL